MGKGYRRESKYHLLTANFNDYDFNKLFNEENENKKCIIWQIGREDGKGAQNYNKGDICYIYYSNLPDGTSRILLRAEVTTSDTDKNINEDVYSYNKENKIKGMWLSNIRAISLNEPENFSKMTLASTYNKNYIQGQQYLGDVSFEGSKEKELISAIEEKYPERGNLKEIRKYFDNYTKCFFSGKDKKSMLLLQVGEVSAFMNDIILF